jgi:hypothetical protein
MRMKTESRDRQSDTDSITCDGDSARSEITSFRARQSHRGPGFQPDEAGRLNFRGVPLQAVFDYISNTAGVFIHAKPNVDVNVRVDAWDAELLDREEALDWLQSVLKEKGCIAIRDGRMLTIVRNEDVKKSCIPLRALSRN